MALFLNAILRVRYRRVQFDNDDDNDDYGLSDLEQAGAMHLLHIFSILILLNAIPRLQFASSSTTEKDTI